MAKTLVIDVSEETRVPFLRGILTRSLHEAGLDFEDAYKLASTIRQDLAEVDEISQDKLRAKVLELLQKGTVKLRKTEMIIPSRERLTFSYLQISGTIPETLLHELKARFRSTRKARADIKCRSCRNRSLIGPWAESRRCA